MANSICQQNWKTLTVLSFNTDDNHESISSEDFKNIIENCTELKEASFRRLYLSTASIDFLCKKLTPKIEKLCLSDVGKVFPKTGIRDEHVKSLVSRCYKLRELDLSVGWRLSPKRFITDKTIDYIIRFLKKSLEKLDLSPCDRSLFRVYLRQRCTVLHTVSAPLMKAYFGSKLPQKTLNKLI